MFSILRIGSRVCFDLGNGYPEIAVGVVCALFALEQSGVFLVEGQENVAVGNCAEFEDVSWVLGPQPQ